MAATSATDAWAVGSIYAGSHQAPLIEHWNGARWAVVPSPSIPGGAALAGVAATAPADAWAVGTLASGGGLIEHWDGHTWALTPSPSMGQFEQLRGVTALTARSAWAVGGVLCPGPGPGLGVRTVTEHWDGRGWRLARSPATGILTGVSAASDSSALGRRILERRPDSDHRAVGRHNLDLARGLMRQPCWVGLLRPQ